ncbi:hypothetical protein [Marinobacter sp. Hex_13]|jgi:hypothetical protein|uniref:hypothetical protein n=1 Tax=Marinobacter sp. Hex_13 TaxID=1795866 RepID=UPI000799BA1A|nr:hypothetical protein [Marinobacter sp. Hex_13]KXJ42261.1 MAG: hypothetical protein AXW11_19300 [Marinobacter sp. Hex_13]
MKKAPPAKARKRPTQRKGNTPKKPTKIARMLALMLAGARLNRFEAADLGDSCFNSTISTLYNDYGLDFDREWEEVDNSFGGTTPVKAYQLADASKERAARFLKRWGVLI